jgi:hypothetical protein
MNCSLTARIDAALDRPLTTQVAALAAELARAPGVEAVLFYGSNLRTGSLDGVLDFYVLTGGRPERGTWPRVSWIERTMGGHVLHAKVATMTLATFDRAARGRLLDTTIWARFVQPAALTWVRDATARKLVVDALAAAAMTASALAAALGPAQGAEKDYWSSLFRATYSAELRVERPGREGAILAAAPAHFDGLMPLAWTAAAIAFERQGELLHPVLAPERRADILRWWRRRRLAGKPLNLRRLARASVTFDGAARYGAWKIERHTGLGVTLPAGADRYPILAVPALARALWHARRSRR